MTAISALSSLEKVVSPLVCDFSRASAEEGQTHKGRMIKEDTEGLPRLLRSLSCSADKVAISGYERGQCRSKLRRGRR